MTWFHIPEDNIL